MTTDEIRQKILYNNNKIKELLDPSVFILQPEVQKYIEENEEIQAQCPLVFRKGECIYCGKAETSLK